MSTLYDVALDVLHRRWAWCWADRIIGSLASVVSPGSPVHTMLVIAKPIKLWAMVVAIGGTFPTIQALDSGIWTGEIRLLLQHLAMIVSGFLGARAGYWLVLPSQGANERCPPAAALFVAWLWLSSSALIARGEPRHGAAGRASSTGSRWTTRCSWTKWSASPESWRSREQTSPSGGAPVRSVEVEVANLPEGHVRLHLEGEAHELLRSPGGRRGGRPQPRSDRKGPQPDVARRQAGLAVAPTLIVLGSTLYVRLEVEGGAGGRLPPSTRSQLHRACRMKAKLMRKAASLSISAAPLAMSAPSAAASASMRFVPPAQHLRARRLASRRRRPAPR